MTRWCGLACVFVTTVACGSSGGGGGCPEGGPCGASGGNGGSAQGGGGYGNSPTGGGGFGNVPTGGGGFGNAPTGGGGFGNAPGGGGFGNAPGGGGFGNAPGGGGFGNAPGGGGIGGSSQCGTQLVGQQCEALSTNDPAQAACLHGVCCDEATTCLADTGCASFIYCTSACLQAGGTPQSCVTECQACLGGQTSADLYNAMGQCVQTCTGADGGA